MPRLSNGVVTSVSIETVLQRAEMESTTSRRWTGSKRAVYECVEAGGQECKSQIQ